MTVLGRCCKGRGSKAGAPGAEPLQPAATWMMHVCDPLPSCRSLHDPKRSYTKQCLGSGASWSGQVHAQGILMSHVHAALVMHTVPQRYTAACHGMRLDSIGVHSIAEAPATPNQHWPDVYACLCKSTATRAALCCNTPHSNYRHSSCAGRLQMQQCWFMPKHARLRWCWTLCTR